MSNVYIQAAIVPDITIILLMHGNIWVYAELWLR